MEVRQGTPSTISLPAQQRLTVVADGVSAGVVTRKGQKAGEADQSNTAVAASATQTFGPYTQTERFLITATAGFLTATMAAVDYQSPEEADAEFATADQGALADTALQPADVGTAAVEDVEFFATAAQGALADTALQPADGAGEVIVITGVGTLTFVGGQLTDFTEEE